MNTFILAELASKMDISGVMCLASILFLIIALIAYCFGPYSGSCTCSIFFLIAVFATGDSSESEGLLAHSANKSYIANKSQTKYIEKDLYDINHPDCIFSVREGIPGRTNNYCVFIPAEEMMIVDGTYRLRPDGKEIVTDDYYLYDETYAPINVAVEYGGSGVPQWVYHPASPCYIFGIGALPAILIGGFVLGKIKG
jgi:hypothetical protein